MSNEKKVKILDYDIEEEIIKLDKEEIKESSITGIYHFNKCIE